MEMSFNAEKIPHVKGQDQKTESLDKAYVMASAHDRFEKLAKVMDDFSKKTPEEKEKDSNTALKELVALGGNAEYVRAVGDLMAESAGAMHDYKEEVADKSIEDLEKDAQSAIKEILSYKHHPLITAEDIPASPDALSGSQGALKAEIANWDLRKTDMAEHQRVVRLTYKFAESNAEIGRRKRYM